jgi:hypothetical protein
LSVSQGSPWAPPDELLELELLELELLELELLELELLEVVAPVDVP